jgi:hypothetical protein
LLLLAAAYCCLLLLAAAACCCLLLFAAASTCSVLYDILTLHSTPSPLFSSPPPATILSCHGTTYRYIYLYGGFEGVSRGFFFSKFVHSFFMGGGTMWRDSYRVRGVRGDVWNHIICGVIHTACGLVPCICDSVTSGWAIFPYIFLVPACAHVCVV